MSVVTSFVLVFNSIDKPVVVSLPLYLAAVGQGQYFVDVTDAANLGARGPNRKMLQLRLAATAVNYADEADVIRRIADAPWKLPAAVMLLMLAENDSRPSVWAFARETIKQPREFLCIVASVPS